MWQLSRQWGGHRLVVQLPAAVVDGHLSALAGLQLGAIQLRASRYKAFSTHRGHVVFTNRHTNTGVDKGVQH
jgi:hypothetical protein